MMLLWKLHLMMIHRELPNTFQAIHIFWVTQLALELIFLYMMSNCAGTCSDQSTASLTIMFGVHRKLTWQIKAHTAANKSDPDLQIF